MPVLLSRYVQLFRTHAGNDPTDKEKVDWLYGVLTVLDAKAGALLAFDGLLIAGAALTYDKFSDKWVSLGLILLSLAAALLSLYVARMSYAFLGNIVPGHADITGELNSLEEVTERRTRILFVAWWLSIIAVYCYIGIVVIHMMTELKLR